MAKKGRLFIVSAPSGCGKTTLCNLLARDLKGARMSVSVTTRPPRDGERDGKDYFFVTRKRFRRMARNGELLEWARNFGYDYGTPKTHVSRLIDKGKDVILAIDVKGAMKVKKRSPGCVSIFIMPPSAAVLRKRLLKRKTDNPAVIKRRLAVAKRELTYAPRYDYKIVNDTLEHALDKLKQVIGSGRSR